MQEVVAEPLFAPHAVREGPALHCEFDTNKVALSFVTKVYCEMPDSVTGTSYWLSTSKILGLKTHLMPELFDFPVNAIS